VLPVVVLPVVVLPVVVLLVVVSSVVGSTAIVSPSRGTIDLRMSVLDHRAGLAKSYCRRERMQFAPHSTLSKNVASHFEVNSLRKSEQISCKIAVVCTP
jgi:hypothetical protein